MAATRLAFAFSVLATGAVAQTERYQAPPLERAAKPHDQFAPAAVEGLAIMPFDVRTFGAFRRMVQARDVAPKVALSDVVSSGATEAVGALSGLRGEVTMRGGRLTVSYGGCTNCAPGPLESATLLVTARVGEWTEATPLARRASETLAGAALDDAIVAAATAHGLDLSKPFPVRLTGPLVDVVMHVLEAPNPAFGGHGSREPMARQDVIRASRTDGRVVGFYGPASLQGVLTHPGEHFHFHWVSEDGSRTAHLDAFGLPPGATVSFPRP